MTHSETPQEVSPPVPRTVPAEPSPSTQRLIGIDLARALAVFGMYAVHLGPSPSVGGVGGWLLGLSEGRASALFATLAGFSLMLIAGRREPKTGLDGRQARARIVIRAVVLLALGTALAATSAGPVVILAYYGVYFLLALPLLRLRAGTLAIIAAGLAVVTPLLKLGLTALVRGPIEETLNAYDPIKQLNDVGVLDLLLTGFYPAITWITFVVAGMALGRLDLAAGAVQRKLAVVGASLVTFAYGMPWLLTKLFDGLRAADQEPWGRGAEKAGAEAFGPGSGGWMPGSDRSEWLLLLAKPHSGSTFDMLGSVGVAILVVVGATVVLARLSWLRRLLTPVIAVGTMSLTAYVGHFLVADMLTVSLGGDAGAASSTMLLWFIVGAIVFAGLWSLVFRRGPLEYLLNAATKPAKFLR